MAYIQSCDDELVIALSSLRYVQDKSMPRKINSRVTNKSASSSNIRAQYSSIVAQSSKEEYPSSTTIPPVSFSRLDSKHLSIEQLNAMLQECIDTAESYAMDEGE